MGLTKAETLVASGPAISAGQCVRFRALALTEMRNYAALNLDLPDKHIVFHGHNGAGKTNLLEAFSLFSPGRGLRRASYETIGRKGGPGGFGIGARIERDGDDVRLATGAGPAFGEQDMARRLRVDGVARRSTEDLSAHVRLTWLTPQMDGLFTGPAADRRRFLDRLTLAIAPAHGRHAVHYEKAMRQRNRLLADRVDEPAWFSGLENEMATHGAAMITARQTLVELLTAANDHLPDGDAFPVADLEIRLAMPEPTDDRPLEERLRQAFRDSRVADMAAGRTLVGPHRGDLEVTHRAKAMPAAVASTGEQKALLAGLVLGHARIIADQSGMCAVLLLDEIGAHFDGRRRAALFDVIDAMGAQAIMTGTEPQLFEHLGARAARFEVKAGEVREDHV